MLIGPMVCVPAGLYPILTAVVLGVVGPLLGARRLGIATVVLVLVAVTFGHQTQGYPGGPGFQRDHRVGPFSPPPTAGPVACPLPARSKALARLRNGPSFNV